ncbi:hypothetical protein [Flammeovirga sp. SJP92]|uniref:hypothetical protein n=1 Tax=Flammeovirga sp. SJP92 TaxID=1775430 RepID=UPI0007898C86|nr:hypothetical protein [Flammeovirga sp. SJP92]KXX72284.1 hypothetical protein AVL50_01395 [Flammeovirga sp. SJP92]
MKERILLPSSRYILGFQNKEERIIQRAYNDFFYPILEEKDIEDKYLFQRGFCKALTLTLYGSLNQEIEFKDILLSHFPENTEEFIIEEVEIKFRDEDLLLLQLYFNQKLSIESIAARTDISKEDVESRVNKLKRMWGQDMPLEEYLLQIEQRQWFKRLSNNPIPLPPKGKKGNHPPVTIGEINKVEETIWDKIKGFFS